MKGILPVLAIWLLVVWLSPPVVQAQQKLAIIGDSIATGAGAVDRDRGGFAARLGEMFQENSPHDYVVRGFARSSLCWLRDADLPFVDSDAFREAIGWKPDRVFVLLGTNDTIDEPRPNWRHHSELAQDVLFLIEQFRQANPEVVIDLLGPLPIRPNQSDDSARRQQLEARAARLPYIKQILRTVAFEQNRVNYHDLARVRFATTDGVHPDTFGHEAIATELYERIGIQWDESNSVFDSLRRAGIPWEEDSWFGFRGLTFKLDGVPCRLVLPDQAAAGRPWVWRARFFGHEPELDLSLLDRGFHLAWCDVANLYGGPEAMSRWDRFYSFLTSDVGLADTCVLEGMSRGGLPVFHWASRHPERVAALYGDNPVCNSLSWPGGRHGKRSDEDWRRLLKAWHADDALSDELPQPIDLDVLRPIAAKRVPIALVVGLEDDVVPAKENGLLLAENYRRLGGPLHVWRKPGAGHHPHGLHPPAPLRRYLAKASGMTFNPAVIAVPSAEYRAGAGWGADWLTAFEHLKRTADEMERCDIAFLGDSITQGLTGHDQRVAQPDGNREFDRWLGDRAAISLGLSGDRTEHVLWRLRHGQLGKLKPNWIVLMIGVNNINAARHTGEETAEGTRVIVDWLRANQPDAKIILYGCFPAGTRPEDPRRYEVDRLHENIAQLADQKHVFYVDLRGQFLNPDGTLNQNMRSDAIHITRDGQSVWLRSVTQFIEHH